MVKKLRKISLVSLLASVIVFGVGISTASAALTLSNLTFVSDGALTINSDTTNGLTLDSTSTGAVNLGTSANAKTITIGNVTGTTTLNLSAGSGGIVMTGVLTATSPVFTTPTLGVATATTVNKVTITAPAASATLTIANTKGLTVSNTLTLAGTDGTTMTFPSTSATIARTDAANTFTGVQTMTSPALTTPAIAGATLTGTINGSGSVFRIPSGAGLADAACSALPGYIYMATTTANAMTADKTYVCNTAGSAWVALN